MALRFSVLVPIYEQWDLVPLLLARLRAQTLAQERFEVVLVDNGSRDFAPPDGLAGNVRVVTCAMPGSYAARNAAAAEARADWFAFTDADCLPEPGWLNALAAAAAGTSADTILVGRVEVRSQGEPPNAYEVYDMIRGIPQERYVSRGYGATANLAVSADLFRRVGGFDGTRLSGGDAEFCRRAVARGAKVRFVPEARADHPARDTWEALAVKSRRVLGGQVAAGSARRRAVFLLRTIGAPLIPAWRFIRAPYPMRQRLTAIGVQLRLWRVELAEAIRLLAGGDAERR